GAAASREPVSGWPSWPSWPPSTVAPRRRRARWVSDRRSPSSCRPAPRPPRRPPRSTSRVPSRSSTRRCTGTTRGPPPHPVPTSAGPSTRVRPHRPRTAPDLRAFVAGLLEEHYDVVVAGDGNTGLRLARTQPFDLVLTDVMMPGLDGFELLTALRADPATAGLPVIMLSARAGQEAVSGGLDAGADDYLVKPFSSADLLARVRSNMELARLRNHGAARRTAMVRALQDGFYLQDISAGGKIIE